MIRLSIAVSFTLMLSTGPACLDAGSGQTVAVHAGGAVDPLAGCPQAAVPPFAHVSQSVGVVALGRCGHLGWVDHRGIQQLLVRGPAGEPVARYPEESGWVRGLTFAPHGTQLAFETVRSDLGFGDHTVVALNAPAVPYGVLDFVGSGAFGFMSAGGAWSCDNGAVGGGGMPRLETLTDAGRVTLSTESDTPMSCTSVVARGDIIVAPGDGAIRWWNLKTGAHAVIDGYWPRWFEGDTYRGRDAFAVSGDGSRVAVGNIGEPLPGVPVGGPPQRQLKVYAIDADKSVASLLADVERAVTAPGSGVMLFGDSDGGAHWIDIDGVQRHAADAIPLAILAGTGRALVQVLGPKGGYGFGVLDLTSGATERLTDSLGAWRLSSDGTTVALTHTSGRPARIAVWRAATGLVDLADAGHSPALHWVGASGAVLASIVGGDAIGEAGDVPTPTLLSPASDILWRAPNARGVDTVVEAAGVLLIAMPTVNDVLVAVDIVTGRAEQVLEGHDFEVWADGAGACIAVRYLPLSATTSHLSFGATPRP